MTEENERPRAYEGFAFGARGREPTELERSLGDIQIKTDCLPEGVKAYEGWFVEARIDDMNVLGIIRGVTCDGGYVFCPTTHRTPSSLIDDKTIPRREKAVWLNRSRIVYGFLKDISESSSQVLDAAGMGFDSVKDAGKVYSLEERS